MPTDRLINALLDLFEITAAARAYSQRSGHPNIVCIRKGPFPLESEPSAPPLAWEETYLLPLPEGHTAQQLAAREHADNYLTFTFGQSSPPPLT